jgi:hypothetical protein
MTSPWQSPGSMDCSSTQSCNGVKCSSLSALYQIEGAAAAPGRFAGRAAASVQTTLPELSSWSLPTGGALLSLVLKNLAVVLSGVE